MDRVITAIRKYKRLTGGDIPRVLLMKAVAPDQVAEAARLGIIIGVGKSCHYRLTEKGETFVSGTAEIPKK